VTKKEELREQLVEQRDRSVAPEQGRDLGTAQPVRARIGDGAADPIEPGVTGGLLQDVAG